MFFSKKEWMEWISYGVVGLFSLSMFVFGVMFPEYTFVNECYEVEQSMELTETQREKLWRALIMEDVNKEKQIKITCLSYEYLKEIIDGWD